MASDIKDKDSTGDTCEFAKRNPVLAKLVPDSMHAQMDKLLPEAAEAALEKAASSTHRKFTETRNSLEDGVGEVAGVLFRVAKHAYERFHIGDLVFGVYHLALHHSTVNEVDAVDGREVTDAALIDFLIQAAADADTAYLPTREELCAAAGIRDDQLLIFQPETTTTRPAYAVWVDEPNRRLVWGFRGTTDLNDMLTDACASCTPYCGGFAHWGMLEAAQWFVDNELPQVLQLLEERPGYELLLVGHSLGAGTAAMLAHQLKNNPAAAAAVPEGVRFRAVGIATPAVLTQQLADACGDYITSVVLMHDMVPRFSINNVFKMKDEMDATDWGEVLKATIADWLVPDAIENTETYQRLARGASHKVHHVKHALHHLGAGMIKRAGGLLHKDNGSDGQINGNGAAAHRTSVAEAAGDLGAVEAAVEEVADKLQGMRQEDVHEVFAPGRLIWIKRLDRHKGRATYGNTVHRCVLCEDDALVPPPEPDSEDGGDAAAADVGELHATTTTTPGGKDGQQQEAAGSSEMYPGAKFQVLEAAAGKRFQKIVLRDTCLSDHLTGGYKQGLYFAREKLRQQQQL